MKRVTILLVIIFTSFSLSACDLIDAEQIKQTTEEICRENPDNELCQNDDLQQLEEQKVKEIFINILDNYNDEANEMFCSDIISTLNMELLDECIINRAILVPAVQNELKTISVTNLDNEYTITTMIEDTEEYIDFKFTIVLENEVLRIKTWSYSEKYTKETIIDVEAVDKGIDMFLKDFNDITLSNEDFCSLWYDGVDEDCDDLGDQRSKSRGITINTSHIEKISEFDTEMVSLKIEYNIDGHVTVLKLNLNLSISDDEVHYKATDFAVLLRGIEKSDIRRGMLLFLDDYGNTELANDEVCAKWFDGLDNDCDGLTRARTKFKAGADLSKKVNILDPDDDDDTILTTSVEYEFRGHVTVLKISYVPSFNDETLTLDIKDVFYTYNDISEAHIAETVSNYIDDLSNFDITDEDICTKWYDGIDNDCDGLVDVRLKFKAGAALSKKVNIMPHDDDNDDDGLLDAIITLDFNGHVTVLKIALNPTSEDGTLKLNISSTNVVEPPVAEELIIDLINTFIVDVENEILTDTEVCTKWFEGIDNDCDGIGAVRTKFKAGADLAKTVYILDPDSDGDGILDAAITFTFEGHVTVLKIAFTITLEGDTVNIKVNRIDMA